MGSRRREKLSILKQGVAVWNGWRHFEIPADLTEANLTEANHHRENEQA
jgi:hypothetical protein